MEVNLRKESNQWELSRNEQPLDHPGKMVIVRECLDQSGVNVVITCLFSVGITSSGYNENSNNYYNVVRTHMSLDWDCPEPRMIEMPELGQITKSPILGSL